jgi:hypothetical protein
LKCKVCGKEAEIKFTAKILFKYDAEYFFCNNCKYLFAGNPFWLEESYREPINLSDTGLLVRNQYFARLVTVIIFFCFYKKGIFLDYAGGYGVFTRLMRDNGYDFYWNDPYCKNLLAAGFEYDIKSNNKIELLTAFEVLEHLTDPSEINKMLTISRNIIFSTQLLPKPIPELGKYWYYGFEHGQHISFYSKETLEYIASKNKLNFYSVLGLHIFTEKRISKIKLNISVILALLGSDRLVKKIMGSKTESDNILMSKRENSN